MASVDGDTIRINLMPTQVEPSSNSIYDFTPTALGQKGYQWAKLVGEILTPAYIETLTGALKDYSPLPELVTLQLYEH
ncbi:MAG: hypothetical protein MJA27_29225, partial [Pseudanabaenales cyanobacterium]|nr:hypothetical protein [Pseudanabaenales cyanobacterium]